MENKLIYSTKDLSIGHDGRILCCGISFDICEGDCIMLCGANGSGKTTLMKKLAADKAGIMIPARIPKVSGFTLKEFVRISCYNKSDMYGKLSPAEESAMNQAIEDLGLTELADRDISTLSDGEFQKAGIASALVRRASVIMLDEPTAFLDAQNRIHVLQTLKEICSRNTAEGHRPAVIFSTHDLYDGLQVCSKVFAIGADCRFHIGSEDTPASKASAVSRIFR